MAAVSAIVLADAQATPVNHTFIPLGKDANGVLWFECQDGPDSIVWSRISLNLKRAPLVSNGTNSGSRTNRVSLGIHLPQPETLGTADNGLKPSSTIAFVPRFTAEFIMSERTTTPIRKDLRTFAEQLMKDPQVYAMVESLQGAWGV